jgi:ABC-type antimicrobial peptide transport system permease subunit
MIEVVGVVPDVINNVTTLEPLVMYMPLAQADAPPPSRAVVLHSAGPASAAARAAVTTLMSMDAALAAPVFTTIDERIGRQMGPQRLGATVLGALGTIAALLTLFGIYVLAESMAIVRRHEMGIRAALGASRWQLGSLVLVETMKLAGAGVLGGLLLAWFGANTIRAFLFRVEPLSPRSVGGVALAILTLALLVSLRPAIHAARVNLAQVLRDE